MFILIAIVRDIRPLIRAHQAQLAYKFPGLFKYSPRADAPSSQTQKPVFRGNLFCELFPVHTQSQNFAKKKYGEISVEQREDKLVIGILGNKYVKGEVNTDRLSDEIESIGKAIKSGTINVSKVIMEFHNVDYINAYELGFLIRFHKVLGESGIKLELHGVNPQFREVLQQIKLNTLFGDEMIEYRNVQPSEENPSPSRHKKTMPSIRLNNPQVNQRPVVYNEIELKQRGHILEIDIRSEKYPEDSTVSHALINEIRSVKERILNGEIQAKRVILNLHGVKLFQSNALGCLVGTHRALKEKGIHFELHGVRASLAEELRVTRLNDLLNAFQEIETEQVCNSSTDENHLTVRFLSSEYREKKVEVLNRELEKLLELYPDLEMLTLDFSGVTYIDPSLFDTVSEIQSKLKKMDGGGLLLYAVSPALINSDFGREIAELENECEKVALIPA